MRCHEQEAQAAGGVADTPYAQIPPLPSWMAEGSSAADPQGLSQPAGVSREALDAQLRAVRALREEVAALEASSFSAAPQASAQERPRTRSRADAPPAQQPIGADALNQALGKTPIDIQCMVYTHSCVSRLAPEAEAKGLTTMR